MLQFFFLLNDLSGLIKVHRIRVKNVSYFCMLSFLYAGSQKLFQARFPLLPPLPVLLRFRGYCSFFLLSTSSPSVAAPQQDTMSHVAFPAVLGQIN